MLQDLIRALREGKAAETSRLSLEKVFTGEVTQPDPRIGLDSLDTFALDGKSYVSHKQPGCVRNACIEFFDSHLRCGFCYTPLTQEAAIHVLDRAEGTDHNTFVWKIIP